VSETVKQKNNASRKRGSFSEFAVWR